MALWKHDTTHETYDDGGTCQPGEEGFTRELAEAHFGDKNFSFVGTPQQIIEQMRPFIALGVDAFLLDCGGFPNLTTLELLVHEVLPVVTQATA